MANTPGANEEMTVAVGVTVARTGVNVGKVAVEDTGVLVGASVGARVAVGKTVRCGTVGSKVATGAASVARGAGLGAPQPTVKAARHKKSSRNLYE